MSKTDNDLAQRIAGRKWAEEVLADLPIDKTEEYQYGFMDRMKRCFAVKELDPQAMTDEEAREFGRQTLGFGAHAGKTYDDCPLAYLEWLTDTKNALDRYLRSRRIYEERRDADAQN